MSARDKLPKTKNIKSRRIPEPRVSCFAYSITPPPIEIRMRISTSCARSIATPSSVELGAISRRSRPGRSRRSPLRPEIAYTPPVCKTEKSSK
jgi:hypothetical protein